MTDTGLTQEGLDWSRPDNVQQNHPSKHINASSNDALPTFHRMLPKKTFIAYANQDHYSTLRFQRADSSSFPHTPNFAPHDLHLHCVVTIVDAGIRRPSVSFGGCGGGGAGMAELTLC